MNLFNFAQCILCEVVECERSEVGSIAVLNGFAVCRFDVIDLDFCSAISVVGVFFNLLVFDCCSRERVDV